MIKKEKPQVKERGHPLWVRRGDYTRESNIDLIGSADGLRALTVGNEEKVGQAFRGEEMPGKGSISLKTEYYVKNRASATESF